MPSDGSRLLQPLGLAAEQRLLPIVPSGEVPFIGRALTCALTPDPDLHPDLHPDLRPDSGPWPSP